MPDQPDSPEAADSSDGEEKLERGFDTREPWWPLSPKLQIVVLAGAIVLFNCILIAIFAAVFLLNSG